MAGLVHGVAGSILVKLGSFAYEEISSAFDMKNDLKKLHDKTLMLQSVLGDAEKKQASNDRLQKWLTRVKDVFHDAIDVLDDFECEALRHQVVKEFRSVGKKVSHFFSHSNPIGFRFSIAHKVREIRERLDEITGEMAQFQLIGTQLKVAEEPSQLSDRMTHSYVKPLGVIGRDRDIDRIVDILGSQDDTKIVEDIFVIPIVGIGGLGKTTIAKSVFNDPKIDEMFDLKIWVCVSLDFEVDRLRREILRETKSKEDIGKMSIEQSQTSLRNNLKGKKLLLVLDDVWNEDRNKWLELRQFLNTGNKGSKLIVTTRSTSVSSIMTGTPPYRLKGLSEERSLYLFFKCAFDDEKLGERYMRVKDIGKEIVKKCGGVPLALKTLGSLLYSKDEVEWVRVRDNNIWELKREDDRILPALLLSYNTMSVSLKQCFAFCSTFPADTSMKSIELIAIWSALGILHSPNKDMELEDIAELHLEELCARSFFQHGDANRGGINDLLEFKLLKDYKMHDLMHDLAYFITKDECCIKKFDMDTLPQKLRHLRISLNQDNLKFFEISQSLWSLHLDDTSTYKITEFFLSECIERLSYLRVFDLKDLSFEVLPNSIENLKHLRYLNLSGNKEIKRLPDSICNLQSLQTLLLGGCVELEELPRDIQRLVSLRTLVVTTKQMCFPENGIGRLKSLRNLIIDESENLLSLPRDMKYCTTLRTLILSKCGELNLACEPDEITVARHLASLTIPKIGHFKQHELRCESSETVHLSLQSFGMEFLPKTTALPLWLQGAAHTLKTMRIADCPRLSALPEWFVKLTSLKKLVLENCSELSSLCKGMSRFTSLTNLEVYCPSPAFYKRYEPHFGRDWPAISHIPKIQFGLLEYTNCSEEVVEK